MSLSECRANLSPRARHRRAGDCPPGTHACSILYLDIIITTSYSPCSRDPYGPPLTSCETSTTGPARALTMFEPGEGDEMKRQNGKKLGLNIETLVAMQSSELEHV